jgi:hypothetical protein
MFDSTPDDALNVADGESLLKALLMPATIIERQLIGV